MLMKTLIPITLALVVSCSMATAGEELYNKKCAACHGKDGKGDTKMGKKKGANDYTDPKVQASFTDAEGVKAILEGTKKDGKTTMKGYEGKITEEEAKALVKYIRTFKK